MKVEPYYFIDSLDMLHVKCCSLTQIYLDDAYINKTSGARLHLSLLQVPHMRRKINPEVRGVYRCFESGA